MKFGICCSLFLLCAPSLFALDAELQAKKVRKNISLPPSVVQAEEKGEYKDAIVALQSLLEKKQTAELYLALAVCLLRDQQEEEAFKAYIKCLELVKSNSPEKMQEREQVAFDELLSCYIANSPDLETKLAQTLTDYPNYLGCQFFLAAQSANQRKYEPFFYLFYQSYCSYPDSFMAHKTRGVVASLVLQRAKSPEEKAIFRIQALDAFKRAFVVCPQDIGLHKMLIYTACDTERKKVIELLLTVIVEKDIKLPRGEIPFYINHALLQDDVQRAELLLEKAKSWYEYSRIIQEMQEMILQHKAKR